MNKFDNVFIENDFVIPDYNNLNIVDLAKYLYSCYGIESDFNKNFEKFQKLIPKNKHTLLILSDGMGSNIIEKMPDDNIIKKNKVSDMITVFPSTTACVLTSLVTAKYPSEHGIWGWYNYYRPKNVNYYPLLFLERGSNKPLSNFGISPKDIFISESKLKHLNCKTTILFPKDINDSIYSDFVSFKKNRFGYKDFNDIVDIFKKECLNDETTFTYLYLPDIDNIEHDYGIDDEKVFRKLNEISALVEKLSKIDDLTIIVTADHGQINIHEDVIMDYNKYNKYFYSEPTIDFGTSFYYVKEEMRKDFVNEFNKDFKNKMYLFETSEFIKKNIFSLYKLDNYSKEGLGEFISLCKPGFCFINSQNVKEYYRKTLGNHSGLTRDEMIIPLIIINSKNIS
jgi:predicted AlkP superfamily pyrophosphatase or phosphodiesterase